ncbi:MAG: hypothetical protein RBT13_07590, partial [Bacteroidales bacterium]|nr:hypothetical protein [Bacteroidales bacterium]
VEGFDFNKGLIREDNTTIKMGDTEEFIVIEFSKENKNIVLSHSRIWQDKLEAERERANEDEAKKAKEASKITKHISSTLERSTLGDLDALINLKADLETEENKEKAKKTKKAKKEVEDKFNEDVVEVTEMSVDASTIEAEKKEEKESKPKKTRTKKAELKEDDITNEAEGK